MSVKKCFCFHSVIEHSEMSVLLSFYHLIILVLVYTQEIDQDIGFQAEHVSRVRSDMNLVRYSAILAQFWDETKGTYYYNI